MLIMCFEIAYSVHFKRLVFYTYRVIKYDCRGFYNLSYTVHSRLECMYFFYLIEQRSKFLLRTLQVLYICTICDAANINTIIEFVPVCSMSAVIIDYRVDVCRITNGAHIEHL